MGAGEARDADALALVADTALVDSAELVALSLLAAVGSGVTGLTLADSEVADTFAVAVLGALNRRSNLAFTADEADVAIALAEETLALTVAVVGAAVGDGASADLLAISAIETDVTSALVVHADTVAAASSFAVARIGLVALAAVGERERISVADIGLDLTESLVEVNRDIAITTLPASNAEAVAVGADTVGKTLGGALNLSLATATDVTGLAEALSKATETALGAAEVAGILSLDRAVWAITAFNAEAAAHVADTTVGAVVGALGGGERGLLASRAAVAGETRAFALNADTVAGARERGTLADHVLRAVGALETGETATLAHQTSALAINAATGADFLFLAEVSRRARVAEALGEATETLALTRLLAVGGEETLAGSGGGAAVSAGVSFSAEAAAVLAHTVAAAVSRAAGVVGILLADISFESGVAEALAVHADTATHAVLVAGALALAVIAFVAGVAEALAVLAQTVLTASLGSALGFLAAVGAGVAGVAEAFTARAIALSAATTFSGGGIVTGAGGGLVAVIAGVSREAGTDSVDAETLVAAALGAGDLAFLAGIAIIAQAFAFNALAATVAVAAAADVTAVISGPLRLADADTLVGERGIGVHLTETVRASAVVGAGESALAAAASESRVA